MRRPNPYSGLVDGLSAGELELLHDAVAERRLREEAGFGVAGRPGRRPSDGETGTKSPRGKAPSSYRLINQRFPNK